MAIKIHTNEHSFSHLTERLPSLFSLAAAWMKRLQSEVEVAAALNALVDRVDLIDVGIRVSLKLPICSTEEQNSANLIAAMPSPSVRAFVLDFSLMIAASAFAVGRLQADSLLKGAGPLLVDVVGSSLQLKSDASHPVSYVGHVADFFVLYDSAQSQVVILNAQKVNSLVLTKNPKAAAF